MTTPETCPRCRRPFACGAHDLAVPCACTTLRLSPETLARLRREYVGCLCVDCLRDVAQSANTRKPRSHRGTES